MARNSSNALRLSLTVAALLCAAGAAAAQCNIIRGHVPDFDQKRDALPNDGNMYCVPTSGVNLAAYIANHGYPPMMGGPKDWQSNSNYNYVTSTDALMGAFMNTDPVDGTTGGGTSGLTAFVFSRGPGLFNVTGWYGNITPIHMYFQMGCNGLVNICYGYYKQNPGPFGNYYTRDGGHCVTLNGMNNVCSAGNDPIVKLRNPADDSNLFSQSTFTTVGSRAIPQTFPSSPLPGITKTRTRLADFGTDSTTRRYIDTMYVIRAAFACWSPASSNAAINVNFAVSLFADPKPQASTINIPSGWIISGMAIHPDQTQLAYLRRPQISPVGGSHTLGLVNLADGSERQVMNIAPAANNKAIIAINRFGDLYACDGSVLKAFDISGPEPVLKHSRTLAQPASSIAFDDTLDELVVLTPANRRLIRCPLDLSSAIDEPLPSAVPAIGDGSVVPDPFSGKYLLTSVTHNAVHQLSLIPGSPRLALDNSLLLPAVSGISDIQPGDMGTFFVLCDGSVKVLDRDPAANRLRVSPNQVFNTLPAMKFMAMSRSRTNFDPEQHSGTPWRNVIDSEGITGTPDCIADFNSDSHVSVQDIFDFLAAWFAENPLADVNDSSSVTVQDIFDFLAAWFAGC